MENKEFNYNKLSDKIKNDIPFLFSFMENQTEAWKPHESRVANIMVTAFQSDYFILSPYHKPISKIIVLNDDEFSENEKNKIVL